MTREQVLAWLDTRRPVPPDSLRARLRTAVEQQRPAVGSALPAYLAQLGRTLLDGVAARADGGRELALDLLAADAFATYAFEAQAEDGRGSSE
jgi:Arc/MetJ family transcription regulator